MNNQKGLVGALLTLFVTTPIWYYLLYKLLEATKASELMWFLFWAYIPIHLFAQILLKAWEYSNKSGR